MRTHNASDHHIATAAWLVLVGLAPSSGATAQTSEAAGDDGAYYVYVAAESEDRVDLIRFDGTSASLLDSVSVGRFPTEIDGPHGLAVDPSGERWYVTLAHGNPFGVVVSYSTATNRPEASAELGFFPATMQVTPAGLLFAANFNLHGDHVPSSVSVVDVGSMIEIAQIPTCTMPHGSRLTADGSRHYSACMMDEALVELDAHRLEVSRMMHLAPGHERPMEVDGAASMATMGDGPRCSPTWAHPNADGSRVYVACNKNAEVLEIDADSWTIARRFTTEPGPYNLDITPDGTRLVVTYKSSHKTGVWDLETGREVARIDNTRRLPHGIAVSPDSRYAFISVEGVGGEPGTVDVIDLERGEKVASVDVGKQAGGIAFWRGGAP
ncbi:MAG: YncE family protein [Gemmatimonadetes bacterium]|nr:YncE family protein [Gemmatimonadota bacterium]